MGRRREEKKRRVGDGNMGMEEERETERMGRRQERRRVRMTEWQEGGNFEIKGEEEEGKGIWE